ncbi:hypothetical protein Hdeb2414_s0020g00567841 [Helianthus debilis subsp. tardiflorus]
MEHLGYASKVWDGVKVRADMGAIPNRWSAIFDYLMGIAKSKKAWHVIAKLVVCASAYFIWNERNRRLFSPQRRNQEQLVNVILSTVRLKLQLMKLVRSYG